MTEYNYLLWCPNCGTRQQFLGGTVSATCLECGLVVMNEQFIELSKKAIRECETEEAMAKYDLMIIEKEEKNKLIKRKIVELFELVKED